MTRAPSGRPGDDEYARYAKADVDQVAGDDAVAALAAQGEDLVALLEPIGEAAARGLTYAPGKWTLKEVVGHLADDERIFVYRALCVARGDTRPLPGFDEKLYGRHSGYEKRSLADVVAEYRAVRAATIAFFAGLPAEAWLRAGTVNDYPATVRGLAFHIAGHELHHLRILREKYLTTDLGGLGG